MNQTLYLLRHAKSEPWSSGINDFGRTLNERGKKHMAILSSWMLKNLPAPKVVLCSASCRTRETLKPFAEKWLETEPNTVYLDEIYEASAGTLHSLAGNAFESTSTVMMVGHNPGFEYLALGLTADSETADITKMATGTLAVIDFPNGYVQDSGEGVLRHWVTRKSLSGE